MPKAVFSTDLGPEMAERITRHAPPDFEVTVCTARDDEAMRRALESAEFLILFGPSPSARALRGARRLELIQLVSAGFEHVDLALCRELGVAVANNGGANSPDVAEHTLALILGVYRRLLEQDRNVRAGRYREINTGLTTYTIRDKTVGIVGLGSIGQTVAGLLRPFGVKLLYYDSRAMPAALERSLEVARVELPELLRESDIVTLHASLNDASRGLIGAAELSLMKTSAILINTCRGGVVDQVALCEALRERRILAAGLDVQEREPPDPNDPLLSLDNVLLTPHSAGVTVDTWTRRGRFVFENCQRVLGGETPLALVGE